MTVTNKKEDWGSLERDLKLGDHTPSEGSCTQSKQEVTEQALKCTGRCHSGKRCYDFPCCSECENLKKPGVV